MLCTKLPVLYLSMLFPPLGLRKMAAPCQSPEGARSDPAKWSKYEGDGKMAQRMAKYEMARPTEV